MRAFYDSTIFSFQIFGGISHYFVELMNHLPDGWNYSLSVRASENEYLKLLKSPRHTFPLRHIPDHKKLSSFINRFSDRRTLRKGDFDIFHPTDYSAYFHKYLTRPYVITVHDLQFLDYVREGVFSREYGEVITDDIRHADGIIAISNATRKDLIEKLDIAPERISVVYHGFSPDYFPDGTRRPEWLPERYILFVGQRGNYKNFATLLEAFHRISLHDPDLRLLCTGRGFSKKEKEDFSRLGVADKIVHRFISQSEMGAVYGNAECFIFPSRREGFGMPILEAFAAGCPAVLSNASCLPEIGGDGALYFNPDDPSELVARIENLLSDQDLRRDLISKGERRLSHFSWEKCGRQTAEVYEKTLGRL